MEPARSALSESIIIYMVITPVHRPATYRWTTSSSRHYITATHWTLDDPRWPLAGSWTLTGAYTCVDIYRYGLVLWSVGCGAVTLRFLCLVGLELL